MYHILGKGNDGFVIEPSIDGEVNMVTKIGNIKLKKEYDNIKSLPRFNELYSNPELTSFRPISKEEMELILNGPVKKNEQMFGITMPKIDGVSLANFLDEFKNIESETNKWHHNYGKDMEIISFDIFINLLERLKIFYNHLIIFNSMGFFHNDITSTNIMIDDKACYLVDFYSLTKDSPKSYPGIPIIDDVTTFKRDVLNELLNVGIFNDDIKEYIKVKGVKITYNGKIPEFINSEFLLLD